MTRFTTSTKKTGFISLRHFIRLTSIVTGTLLIMQFLVLHAAAKQVTLAWDAPTDAAIIGYKLHYGISPGIYTQVIDAGYTTAYTLAGLSDTQPYYFVVTAYDSESNESGYSNEASTISYDTPNPLPDSGDSTLPDGDVNGDGTVDLQDALQALRISTGLISVQADHLVRADVAPLVNGRPAPDSKIDLADALLILRKTVGLKTW
jgi:hypothetical protein